MNAQGKIESAKELEERQTQLRNFSYVEEEMHPRPQTLRFDNILGLFLKFSNYLEKVPSGDS